MYASRDLAGLARQFYDAAVDDTRWSAVIEALKASFAISHVGFGWFEMPSAGNGAVTAHMLHSDCAPHFEQLFVELGPANFFMPRMGMAAVGELFSDRDVLKREDFQSSALFNDWFVPQGDHAAAVLKVEDRAGSQGFLMMQRSQRESIFLGDDESDLRRLAPALVHAVAVRRKLAESRLRQKSEGFELAGIGFAVTDAQGQLLFGNGTIERHFAAGLGLILRQGRVGSARRSGLQQLIAGAASNRLGGDLVLTYGEMDRPGLAVTVAPIVDGPVFNVPGGKGAMLIVQQLAARLPDDFERRLQAMFGLTPKEASLAAALSSGLSIQEAAAERFISMPTARTQLASVFRKTGVTQQSQLVALLLRVLPVTG